MATRKIVTRVIPALTARTHLGEVMRRAVEGNERFIVDKKGQSQVVILSIEDYLANFVKHPQSLTALHRTAKSRHIDQMTHAAVDREVSRIRKQLSREE